MLLKFSPPPEHSDCPYRQVHYGYDFSGGAVCDVRDELHARKLLGTRHFVEIHPVDDTQHDEPRRSYHEQNRSMKSKKARS